MIKLSLSLSLSVAAVVFAAGCLDVPEGGEAEAALEIGVCGANMVPITGVTCRYGPGGLALAGTGDRRHAVVETGPDGLDYAVCYVEIDCRVYGQGLNGSRGCQSIVGTGCPPITMTRIDRQAFLLPPGSMPTAEELAAYCAYEVPAQPHCDRIDWTYVEQGEDLCCVLREPVVPPGPPGTPVTPIVAD